jgi:DNA-binding Lrp family transcriptional regulator
MIVDKLDKELLATLANGLPLTVTPYADIARELGTAEADVLRRLRRLVQQGVIGRFGVVVRHRELGFVANAMAVWDVPDNQVMDVGCCLAAYPFVTLCYQRPRRPPAWPYNVFCMIHGRDRATVLEQIGQLNRDLGLGHLPQTVLFSLQRFKQRGAVYCHAPSKESAA